MTFEVPKISQGEQSYFSKNIFMQGAQRKPVSFTGGINQGTSSGGLSSQLDQIHNDTAKKYNDPTTYGLYGAPTPDAGCGEKLWGYC